MALLFFAGLSLNLLLAFALGLGELISRERSPAPLLYYPWGIHFVSTLLLWVFFARIISFAGGIFDHALLFPLSALTGMGLEKLLFRLLPRLGTNPGVFAPGSASNGLSLVSLLLTLQFALSFFEALLLSFTFAAGGLAAFLVIKEIQKRSFLELIPYRLRGAPVLLISLGILSMVCSAASALLLKMGLSGHAGF
ncbi:MAG: hypothetical protein LBD09_01945 [Treponema sp.]|nr:hypothetical protein [Treponema sp.]